jgi:hypothetical protein
VNDKLASIRQPDEADTAQAVDCPPYRQAGTMLLHDVHEGQHHLLDRPLSRFAYVPRSLKYLI